MDRHEQDERSAGVTTPETAVLARLGTLYRILFVSSFILFASLLATASAIYFSLSGATGTFVQGLATNALASLLLIVIAPMIFSVLSHKPRPYFLVFGVVACAFIMAAAVTDGGLRDFLLNFGSGLFFLLAVDYYISRRFQAWIDKLEGEMKEMIKDVQPVL